MIKRSNKSNTKIIVFGAVIASGILAIIIFVIILVVHLKRKSEDYIDAKKSNDCESSIKESSCSNLDNFNNSHSHSNR